MRVSDCTAGGTGSDAMHIYSSTVSGGTFYRSVTSWGTISGGTFYDGVMNNYGTISGATFYGGIANINEGTVSEITVTYQVNGAQAIALLNAAKIGSEVSTWDSTTKTLTLKGISFVTDSTALKTKALELSGGIAGSGYTNETDSDTYIQTDGNTPVKFAVRSAAYNKVDAALDKAKALNRSLYKDFSAVGAAVNAVDRGKNITEQAEVDAMATAIENAIAALEKAPAAVNPSDKSPRTGNASYLGSWIALLFVSGGAAVGITLVGRRKKRIKF